MGLITLIFLLILTSFYLSKSMKKKPEVLVRVIEKITTHIDVIAVWAAIYGIFASSLTIIMTFGPAEMLLRLIANVMVIIMALPFVFDRVVARLDERFHEKMQTNLAIVREAKNLVESVTRHGEYVGYAGALLSLFLFGVIFR